MDAAATLPEREPVRIYGTTLGCATAIVLVSAILELVRSRVSPAAINPFAVPPPRVGVTPPR